MNAQWQSELLIHEPNRALQAQLIKGTDRQRDLDLGNSTTPQRTSPLSRLFSLSWLHQLVGRVDVNDGFSLSFSKLSSMDCEETEDNTSWTDRVSD